MVVVSLVRLALTSLPFRTFLRLLTRLASPPGPPLRTGYVYADQAVAAAARARRLLPGGTRLADALSVLVLLARWGHPASLTVAVAEGSPSARRSAVWIECDGRVLFGGPEPRGFTVVWRIFLPAGGTSRRAAGPTCA